MNSNFRLLLPAVQSSKAKVPIIRAFPKCAYSSDTGDIKIPKRIPRGPTDILKALSSCVGVDPTAAHYKFHDDPYLMPYSNPNKRAYALSQEAGRKAALWHKVADPMIEAYVPTQAFTDESTVNEDVLASLISKQQVTDVMTVYGILKKRGNDVSVELKQKILELTCFYNSTDPLSEEWVEENWFRHGKPTGRVSQFSKKTWKDGGFAEKLFDEIIETGGNVDKASCALITGMIIHGQLDEAWKRFEECKQKGVKMNTDVYNALISKATSLRDSHDMAWQFIMQTLTEMKHYGLRPNLTTLNNVLQSLEMMASNRSSRPNALNTIAEFQALGIKPSLASFAHLIRIFQKDKRQMLGLILSTIEELEANSEALMTPRARDDNQFFVRAMESINHCGDRVLADRLDSLLHHAKNYSLIGNSHSESVYYRNYFLLVLGTEEIDDFMDFYGKYVPTLYIPEISIMQEVIKSVEVQMGWKHIPKLWGDIILFEHLRAETISYLLSVAVQAIMDDSDHSKAMGDVAWSVWEKIESGYLKQLSWTGEMLGDVLTLLVAAQELAKAHIVMDKIDRHQNSITGEPLPHSFERYIQACLEVANVDAALRCVRHCDARGRLETEQLLSKITNSGLTFDGPQQRVIGEIQRKF
ncbi:unnamed protein product [Nesidiocoris tenuis]|uniref:Small ribosomal subunit protein mS39 n=1 Tax=Nesidiocoris tenuis TaxID=355587 RepID=A0A6H5H575_9HEMI|nr:unnamed protein product [Nesidiocoris tenuis]